MLNSFTEAEKAKAIAWWHSHPFRTIKKSAEASGMTEWLLRNSYPFVHHEHFRTGQAIHCLMLYGYKKNASLQQEYGISVPTLRKARRFMEVKGWKIPASSDHTTKLSHTPEQVAERQYTPVVASPNEVGGILIEEIARLQRKGGGQRDDDGKPRHDLIAPEMLDGVAAVLACGVKKYGERDWEKGLLWGNTLASTMRHLIAWMQREELDEESGLPHLDHAACNIMFLCAFAHRGIGTDSRGEVVTGAALRDAGIKAVLKRAGKRWKLAVMQELASIPSGTQLTAETFRLRCEAKGIRPHHNNAWGGVWHGFVRKGYVQLVTYNSHTR